MSTDTIFNDPELGPINIEVGKEDLDDLAGRIASVDPENTDAPDAV